MKPNVKLTLVEDVRTLSSLANTLKSTFARRHVIDAKSILGILA